MCVTFRFISSPGARPPVSEGSADLLSHRHNSWLTRQELHIPRPSQKFLIISPYFIPPFPDVLICFVNWSPSSARAVRSSPLVPLRIAQRRSGSPRLAADECGARALRDEKDENVWEAPAGRPLARVSRTPPPGPAPTTCSPPPPGIRPSPHLHIRRTSAGLDYLAARETRQLLLPPRENRAPDAARPGTDGGDGEGAGFGARIARRDLRACEMAYLLRGPRACSGHVRGSSTCL